MTPIESANYGREVSATTARTPVNLLATDKPTELGKQHLLRDFGEEVMPKSPSVHRLPCVRVRHLAHQASDGNDRQQVLVIDVLRRDHGVSI